MSVSNEPFLEIYGISIDLAYEYDLEDDIVGTIPHCIMIIFSF